MSASVGLGSGVAEVGPESGAGRWASGAEILESGAGGGLESGAGLREEKKNV